ncbi:unnamed protein product [Durusdinium trenchii]|uniref:NADP-dependent oxidoreductase domain-containing protein n=1 Tax=Durusdinium trenchii TaxID=1381693 RepID=A0ABP0MBH8_9DINO
MFSVRMPRFPVMALVFALPAAAAVFVPTVRIGPNKDVEMQMIAFGTYRHSLTSCDVISGVMQWLELGGRHIDTAHDYGTEPDVGKAIRLSNVPRKEIFITTKIPGPIGRDAVKTLVLNETLPKLGTEYAARRRIRWRDVERELSGSASGCLQVDLLLIHTPCLERSDFPNKCGSKLRAERLDTYRGLMELRAAGKIRAIGVSNYLAEQVEEVVAELKEAPAVNQVEWHLAYHNETLRQRMESSSVRLEAWASLAGPTGQGSPSISLADERLKKVAGRYNMSTAQLELRWETLRGVVPVTATCSREHAVGDMNSFNFNLSNEDLDYLDSLPALMETSLLL